MTFNADVAPILERECISCHQPGGAAPFSLASYAEAAKKALDIAKATRSRFMPPWLPEHGYGEFAGERRLSEEEIQVLQRWAVEDSPEGDPVLRRDPILKVGGWSAGAPDLVLNMPKPFVLPAEGKDVYRNFVIPVPSQERRFVRAVEFQPKSKAVHHLFLLVDPTQTSARMDRSDSQPGFGGMALPSSVESPGGYFLSWQPGREAVRSEPGMPWSLPPKADLVLQMHMQPSGKPESIQSSIGFYFSDEQPTNAPFKLALSSYHIDISPGVSEYKVEQSYVLPSDLQLLGILPHAHYLGKSLQALAILPNGQTNWLLKINDWDFNWQSAYRYRTRVPLSKGTKLVMRYTYDNSTNNVRNPHNPPKRVQYGLQSTNEMAGLMFQMLALTREDRTALDLDYQKWMARDVIDLNTVLLERDPNDAHAHVQLGKALLLTDQTRAALEHFERGVQLNPDEEEGHYHLGLVALNGRNFPKAIAEFTRAIQLNPEAVDARSNLGLAFLRQRRFAEAEQQFKAALKIAPDDKIILSNLELLNPLRTGRDTVAPLPK